MKKLLVILFLLLPGSIYASTEGPALDRAPIDPRDAASLQRGARIFVNYCLNCHSAEFMRFKGLESFGLTPDEIRENLIFTDAKIGDTMKIAMNRREAKSWFGAAPPDLSVIARSRGADWLYSYLRTFYRDDSTLTGWNNLVFPNVGMPNVLWQLQGEQAAKVEETTDAHGQKVEHRQLVLEQKGSLTPVEYDQAVADLVNYLVYMGEPNRAKRIQMGIIALFLLGVLFVFAYWLKKEYWKDVH
jgi:ubiquinol-cytochrome c reductase cytochrome c1 subunit